MEDQMKKVFLISLAVVFTFTLLAGSVAYSDVANLEKIGYLNKQTKRRQQILFLKT